MAVENINWTELDSKYLNKWVCVSTQPNSAWTEPKKITKILRSSDTLYFVLNNAMSETVMADCCWEYTTKKIV